MSIYLVSVVIGNIREEHQCSDKVPRHMGREEIEEAAVDALVSGVSLNESWHSPTGMVE